MACPAGEDPKVKKILVVAALFAAAWVVSQRMEPATAPRLEAPGAAETGSAQESHSYRTGDQVRGSGTVIRILSDDDTGSRHQRFILRLPSGQTLLIAHNIDLAPRIPALHAGDRVSFYGEYAWNNKGGVIHWTHRDPAGRHIAGWLEHDGRRYQ
jgi:hypothetical protein